MGKKEDEGGVLHRIVRVEEGDQSDPVMPLLFSVAIHDPLEEASRELRPEEHLIAHLDDVCFSSDVPNRTRTTFGSLGEKMFSQAERCWGHHRVRERSWTTGCEYGVPVDNRGRHSLRTSVPNWR